VFPKKRHVTHLETPKQPVKLAEILLFVLLQWEFQEGVSSPMGIFG
jgi:hypothetical protein